MGIEQKPTGQISTATRVTVFGREVMLPPDVKPPRVEHRHDGRYEIRKMVRGKPFRWTKPTPDAVLFAWLAELHPELVGATNPSGTGGVGKPRTAGELIDRYLAYAKARMLAGSAEVSADATHGQATRRGRKERKKRAIGRKTYAGYERLFRLHVRPALVTVMLDHADQPVRMRLESVAVDSLTPAMVDEMIDSVADKGLSESQQSQAGTALSAAYTWAIVKQRWLTVNPVAAADVPSPEVEPVPLEDIPTRRQVKVLLDWCEANDDPLATYLRTGFTLGFRAGEISGLTIDSLGFGPHQHNGPHLPDRVSILTQPQLLRDDLTDERIWSIELPKTQRRRTLSLPHRLAVELVKQAEKMRRQEELHPDWDPTWSGYLFRREDGTPIPSDEVTHLLQTRLAAAGLPRWTFHKATRHFATSCWIMAGYSADVIAKWTGHASRTMIDQRYGHLFEEVNIKGASEVERLIDEAAEFLPAPEAVADLGAPST